MTIDAYNSLVSETEKVGIGIPAQFSNLNSFQLQIQWIEAVGLSFTNKQRRQETVDKLNGLEQIKVEKATELIKRNINGDDFKKYKNIIDEAFFAFVKDLSNSRLTGMTDLEYFYLNHLLVRETGVQSFKGDEEYSKKEKELNKKLWELLYYRFVYDFLQKVEKMRLRANDEKGVRDLKNNFGMGAKEEQNEKQGKEQIEPHNNIIEIPALRQKSEYEALFRQSINVLKQKNGNSGLIEMPEGIPTFVLSDIHARPDFVWSFMNSRISSMGGKTVIELLEEGKINVVCVGDYFHSEKMGNRNLMSYKTDQDGKVVFDDNQNPILTEYGEILSRVSKAEGVNTRDALGIIKTNPNYKEELKKITKMEETLLEEEMKRNFYTIELLLKISNRFPNFFMCRGNHDFTKYAGVSKFSDEGRIMKKIITNRYGDDFLDLWNDLESQFGLMATQRKTGLIVSHTFGNQPINEQNVKGREKETTKTLVWSDNRNIPEADLRDRFNQTCVNFGINPDDVTWVIGHRPIEEGTNHRDQLNGKLIQINDDKRNLVALIGNDGKLEKVFDLKQKQS